LSKRVKCLDDTDSVGNVQSIGLRDQTNVSLLHTVGTDEGVDGSDLDVVQFLNSKLDLLLSGSVGDDKDESVALLDLLHGRLRGQRVLQDIELSELVVLGV